MSAPVISRATITDARMETPSIRRLTFSVTESAFTFLPGQWIDLARDPAGAAGGYSMANAPGEGGDDVIELGIRRSGHPVSAWLFESAQPGDEVWIRGGQGTCIYMPAAGDDVVFVAGGVGITPMLSMARAAHRSPHPLRAALLYSVRAEEDVAFQRELAILEEDERFSVSVQISQEAGHLTPEAVLAAGGHAEATVIYLCGPTAMVDTLAEGLERLGVSQSRIRFEKWW